MKNLLGMPFSLFILTIPRPFKLFGSSGLFSIFLSAKEPAVANGTVRGRRTTPWHGSMEKRRT